MTGQSYNFVTETSTVRVETKDTLILVTLVGDSLCEWLITQDEARAIAQGIVGVVGYTEPQP